MLSEVFFLSAVGLVGMPIRVKFMSLADERFVLSKIIDSVAGDKNLSGIGLQHL